MEAYGLVSGCLAPMGRRMNPPPHICTNMSQRVKGAIGEVLQENMC